MPDPAAGGAAASTSTTTYITTKKFDTGSITKLSADNYRVWKIRMTSIFTTHKSMKVVDGTEARPTSSGQKQEDWDQKASEAFTAMLMSMGDDQVEAVSSCKTAQEIWQKLSVMYESTSGENKQLLWQQFYSITAKDSPVKTMCEIQNIAAQLHSLKVTIIDDAIVARVISSLVDDKYRQFREAWRSVAIADQTSALLLSRLKIWELEEGRPSVSEKETSESASKAFKSQPKKRMSKEEIDKLKQKTKCNACGKKGHWRRECPSKKSESKKETAAEPDSHSDPKAYANGKREEEIWYNDSGATQHYCGSLSWFITYEEYDRPKHVEIADGSYGQILGSGTVRVHALTQGKWEPVDLLNVQYIPGGPNLFSEGVMMTRGYDVLKNARTGKVTYQRNGIHALSAYVQGNMQIMNFRRMADVGKALSVRPERWHERLAHINVQALKNTVQQGAAYGLEGIKFMSLNCDPFINAKSTAESY